MLPLFFFNVKDNRTGIQHNGSAACCQCLPHIVGDHQSRQIALMDNIISYGHHLLSCGRIQSRRMFIQKQQLRCHNGTHQQCNYLSLSTG